jgi:Ca2+-binding RTX toxin-like protein
MPSYTLEIEAFGVYSTNMPLLEIWEDGVLDSTHSISSNGSTISVTINYGGTVPTSLSFTFNDGFAAAGRTIEIRSVKINDQYVNVGNYLSSDSLAKSATSTVDIASSEFLFDSSDPSAGDFVIGATQAFTGGADLYRDFMGSSPQIFDMLGGRDVAYLGSGNDKVSGGAGNDVLRGGGGDDLLFGGADNDRLYGGAGDDTLYGGTGDDRIHGGADNDEIHGGAGNDRLNGQTGNDVITGGAGDDKLTGADGDDYLFGGADNDLLSGGNGADTLDGGDGDDVAYGGAGVDHINGGDGNDVLVGGTGDDVIRGDDGNDKLYGLQDDDDLYGGNGDDELYGGGGVDTIEGGAGDDIINGGAGNDIIYANADTNIYDADWSYKRSITIDSSFVGSDMTNFTVLITEDGMDANFWSNVKADGSDILITLADGITVLDREVVSIDTVAETLEVHIRIPNLSSTVDTELKLHYGNATVTLTNDVTTWDESYQGVWHLDDDLGGTVIEDSSRNQLDGAARGGLTSGDIVGAQIGDGLQFNNAEYIALNHNYTSAGEVGEVSVTAWINTTHSGGGLTANWAILDFDRSEFFNVYVDRTTGQLTFSTNAGGINDFSAGAAINDGSWHHIAAVYDGTDKILYVDGVEVGRDVNAHGGTALGSNNTRFGFIGDGSEATTFDGARNNGYYDGQFDDIRFTESTLTADEIAAQYNNQNSPSTFYNVGAVETTLITETDDNDILEGGDGDDILYASAGNDSLNGGDGFDILYGGSGITTFIFEAASAYNDVDEIINYRFSEGDILDISDLIVGAFSGTITDYVQLTNSGTDTLIQIDANGLTGGSAFTTVGQINNITGLDEVTLYTDGNIVV